MSSGAVDDESIWRPKRQIGVGDLKISEHAKRLVAEVLESNRLTYGPKSRDFEAQFARLHGSRFGVLSNSGTSSLHVALLALKEIHQWSDGDEVLVPAITFVATANAVLHARLTPVFVDVDPKTFTIDPGRVAEHITERTRCLIPVHLCGLTANMAAISQIADQRNLRMVEDSCEAMFVSTHEKSVGSWGDVGCFSFYAAHLLVTGVGGMSIANEPRVAQLMRSLCNHGRNPSYVAMDDDQTESLEAFADVVKSRFNFERVGYSYRITEIEAALGLAQLLEREAILAARERAASLLSSGLSKLAHDNFITLQHTPEWAQHSHMMFPIILSDGIDVQQVTMEIELAGIETRPFFPMVSEAVFRNYVVDASLDYPVSYRLSRQGFYVGCHQGLELREIEYMVSMIDRAVRIAGRRLG